MTQQQIEAQARAFAQQTQWDGNAAIIFIRELLTDINMHTVCKRFDVSGSMAGFRGSGGTNFDGF